MKIAVAVLALVFLSSPVHAQLGFQGYVHPSDLPDRLLPEEQEIYDEVGPAADSYCAALGDACRRSAAEYILRALNARRDIKYSFGSYDIQATLTNRCRRLVPAIRTEGVAAWEACLERFARSSTEEVMVAAGERRLGVTLRGRYRLREGMPFAAVEYILGNNYELSASSGSYEIYTWRGGANALLTASFQDGRLTGTSQLGLR